ncbi:unnamed protein product [Heligmosomoides polygyrus]|uniref:Gamma-secretase subunit PEN-2 n=1 Tax=Heligmosomoides polygyrus TaxID=6339 RepID=A0A183F4U0_HELPZ|nr:unnamed protein product [Heligmosomoides polygyrus]
MGNMFNYPSEGRPMDLRNMNDAAKVDLCRKYFIVGLFGLPLEHILVLWLRLSSTAITGHQYQSEVCHAECQGAIFWLIVICVWETIFQSYRSRSVAWADYLTFIFSVGRV